MTAQPDIDDVLLAALAGLVLTRRRRGHGVGPARAHPGRAKQMHQVIRADEGE